MKADNYSGATNRLVRKKDWRTGKCHNKYLQRSVEETNNWLLWTQLFGAWMRLEASQDEGIWTGFEGSVRVGWKTWKNSE